jgi:transcriptional regulator of acetoin/glycerol metabolism
LRARPAPITATPAPPATSAPAASDAAVPVPDKDQLLELLKRHKGVIADIARATGRSRKQVYRWLDKHGLRAQAAGGDVEE